MLINASDYPSFSDAVFAAVSGDIILFDTDQAITANLSIPASISLIREKGARFVASSTAITFSSQGTLSADKLKLFEGFGDGKVALGNRVTAYPEWWGAQDGSGQDHLAINNAILAAMHIDLIGDYFCAGKVLIPYGGYLSNRKQIASSVGRSRLFANTAGMTLLHLADSFTTIKGIDLNANAQGVTLMKMMPELEGLNTAVGNQNHNDIDVGLYGGDYGLIMMAGRAIGGQASGCWYNHIDLYATSNGTALWLKDNGSTDILSSGSNSNTFEGTMNGSIGLGVRIDAGGGNRFHIQQENLTKGISVKDAMTNGGDNPNNVFHDWHGENIATHAEINEPTTKFFNSDLDHTKVMGTARETFLDDGHTRYKVPTLTADTGTITLTANSLVSYQEKDGRMFVEGYMQVASISGSLTGVLHVPGIAKPCLAGIQYRSGGDALINSLIGGSGAASCACRILEGNLNANGTIDFFGSNEGNLKYLAPYIQVGTNITFSINYPVR